MTRKIKKKDTVAPRLSLLQKDLPQQSAEEERPLFSFRYLNMEVSVKKGEEKVFRKFVARLQKLSDMTWKDVNTSDRHGYGWELIDRDSLKPKKSLPRQLSDIEKFRVFRYDSENHPFVAFVKDCTIYPLFIEANFGEIYKHS